MVGDIKLPIYPRPQDIVILLKTVEEVLGEGSIGVIFSFGEKLGRKYIRNMDGTDWMQRQGAIKSLLRKLIASGWYEDIEFEDTRDGARITIYKNFENISGMRHCDFIRGFIAGIYSEIAGRNYLCKEIGHDLQRSVCKFTVEKV